MKYVILSDSDNVEPFITPRQLTKINGENLIERTVRLLKENGIKDILITSHDERFDNLGGIRYEPKFNHYRPKENKGYWVEAFSTELLQEPVTFLLGDVYYSENAIKTIVESKTNSILYFCSYKNTDERYIKHHDEPFGFKVVDYNMFKEHIERMKEYKDSGKALREPIAWELYRSINNIPITTHKIEDNCVIINDETCDIDRVEDVELIKFKLGGEDTMVKVKALREFTYGNFDKITNLVRYDKEKKEDGRLYEKDTFECTKEMATYLTGGCGYVLVKILEVIPEETKEEPKVEEPVKEEVKKPNKKRKKK